MIATTADALLLDVLLAPEEDWPRLILADWLADNGDVDRGEFIRCQISMEAMTDDECSQCRARRTGGQHTNGPCRCSARLKAAKQREYGLAFRHIVEWSGNLPGLLSIPAENLMEFRDPAPWRFRRGFIDHVDLPLAAFMAEGAAAKIFAAHPVRSVRLVDREPRCSGTIQFGWWNDDRAPAQDPTDPDDLPGGLWHLLPAANTGSGSGWIWYATTDAAHADLSAAAVRYGRRAAGLEGKP
jgi:uncharacterized protein (TIGR02996 family)